MLKHVILARVLTYMALKPQPFRVIDTHAGIGRYDLASVEAGKTGEWHGGIERLLTTPMGAPVAALLQPYLDAVAAVNAPDRLAVYPGSPLIALHLMRAGDHLVANELHDDDVAQLRRELHKARETNVLNLDAWCAVKALLPPKERRGVILIDPPFEQTDEFERMGDAVEQGLRRFQTGVFVIWYPLKDRAAADCFLARAEQAANGKALDARLRVRAPAAGQGLSEAGVVVLNPPYTLRAELETLLPFLVAALADSPNGRFELNNAKN